MQSQLQKVRVSIDIIGRLSTVSHAGHVQDIDVRTNGVLGIGAHATVIPAKCIRAFGSNLITVDSVAN